MKKVTLPLEFVKEAYKAACNDWKQRIEEHVPELGKPKTGWYWWKTECNMNLVYYNNGKETYGFWNGKWRDSLMFSWLLDQIPATDKEVEDALIKEAKRRGFKKGVVTECVSFPDGKENITDNNFRFSTIYNNYRLLVSSNSSTNWVCIFENGKWADIIVNPIPKSLQKAIDKLGKEKILEYLK